MQSVSRWKTGCWILIALFANIGFVLGELRFNWLLLTFVVWGAWWMSAVLGVYLTALLYIITLSFNSLLCGLALTEPVTSKKWALAITCLPVALPLASLLSGLFAIFQ